MKHIIISSLYLVIVFCISKFLFDPANLYWEIWWLDIPMHVMGGFGVASLSGAILSYRKEKISYKKLFIIYLIIAILWELYEHINNFLEMGNWVGLRTVSYDSFDTIKDIFDGFIGMSIAYLFVRK